MRKAVLRCTRPIHHNLRDKKLDFFFEFMQGELCGSLLDVGGGFGLNSEFLRLHQAFSDVIIVNVATPPKWNAVLRTQKPELILGDGCRLPLRSGSVDWVFSNAVIEHVGNWERQRQFANEIRRVARKGYFVTTPNKYFPIEPHTYLPFYQFLSEPAQRKVVGLAPAWVHSYEEAKQIELLSAKQMGQLFPEADVRKIGFPVLPNSLIAYHRIQ